MSEKFGSENVTTDPKNATPDLENATPGFEISDKQVDEFLVRLLDEHASKLREAKPELSDEEIILELLKHEMIKMVIPINVIEIWKAGFIKSDQKIAVDGDNSKSEILSPVSPQTKEAALAKYKELKAFSDQMNNHALVQSLSDEEYDKYQKKVESVRFNLSAAYDELAACFPEKTPAEFESYLYNLWLDGDGDNVQDEQNLDEQIDSEEGRQLLTNLREHVSEQVEEISGQKQGDGDYGITYENLMLYLMRDIQMNGRPLSPSNKKNS